MNEAIASYDESELFAFLEKRKRVLTGVCITGGEPTLHPDLPDLIRRIRELGYCVKLDTNGSDPQMLERLIADKLIDYCAMDIKNSPAKYGITVGLDPQKAADFDRSAIDASVRILMTQQTIPYEFRTTIVRELHEKEDMLAIAQWIAGANAYFLQSYTDSEGVLCRGFHAHSEETLKSYASLCQEFVPNTALRGV